MEKRHRASDAELSWCMPARYVARVAGGLLDPREQREIGFPWSDEMVERSRRSVGATIAACRAALLDGFAANLAGGTHHSYASHGAGFCVFNDAAVAARVIQAEAAQVGARTVQLRSSISTCTRATAPRLSFGRSRRVHAVVAWRIELSVRKESSDLDVALPDGCDDANYMEALEKHWRRCSIAFSRQCLSIWRARIPTRVIAWDGCRSIDGFARRDSWVFAMAASRDLPVAITMAGGYGRDIDVTVDVHLQTIQLAAVAAGLSRASMPGLPAGTVDLKTVRNGVHQIC